MERSARSFEHALAKAIRDLGIGAVWTVIDSRVPAHATELIEHLGREPLQRKRVRSLGLAALRLDNVRAPRLRGRDRKGT